MSAELVASAHKTVLISLSQDRARLGSDGAILIERAFAELAPGNVAIFAAIRRASSLMSSLAAERPLSIGLGRTSGAAAGYP